MYKHAIFALVGLVALACGGPVVESTTTPTTTRVPPSTPTSRPTALRTLAPTATPTPEVVEDPQGRLERGVTYVAHPFATEWVNFEFQVPSANWNASGEPERTFGVVGNSPGVGLGFLKVLSLNGDACHWAGTDDDIEIGETVVDLLEALARSTNLDAGNPYAEHTASMTGQGVELTMPATLALTDCDEQEYRIWNAEGFDIHAQGPSNIWRLGIFDDFTDEPLIVLASSMPDTPDAVYRELWDGIFRSVSISTGS